MWVLSNSFRVVAYKALQFEDCIVVDGASAALAQWSLRRSWEETEKKQRSVEFRILCRENKREQFF